MEEDGELHSHLIWEIVIFIAAIVSVTSVAIELTMHVSEETEHLLHTIDFIAICLFSVDIAWKYRVFKHHAKSSREFFRQSWLDIIAIIPVFRIFRIGRFARLARLARMQKMSKAGRLSKITKATKATKTSRKLAKSGERAYKGVSGVAHSRHVKEGIEHLKEDEEED
jgi:hypothetical protein